MPATAKQKRMAGAELGRLRAGKKIRTGMSEAQLKEMVKSPTRLPVRKGKRGQ